MNYTQNEKIEQVKDSTLVVGVDIGSQTHYARAFDNRGREPTGHYWFAFAKYVSDYQKTLVMVNPFSVKKIKELDDNSPKKTDSKDPKTIAKLVVDGDIQFLTCQKAFMPK